MPPDYRRMFLALFPGTQDTLPEPWVKLLHALPSALTGEPPEEVAIVREILRDLPSMQNLLKRQGYRQPLEEALAAIGAGVPAPAWHDDRRQAARLRLIFLRLLEGQPGSLDNDDQLRLRVLVYGSHA
jgi:hypothetical protein